MRFNNNDPAVTVKQAETGFEIRGAPEIDRVRDTANTLENNNVINKHLTSKAWEDLHNQPSLVQDDPQQPAKLMSQVAVPEMLPHQPHKYVIGSTKAVDELMKKSMTREPNGFNLTRYIQLEGDQ